MEKFIEVKEATRQAVKQNEQRSSSVDARQTSRVRFSSNGLLTEKVGLRIISVGR